MLRIQQGRWLCQGRRAFSIMSRSGELGTHQPNKISIHKLSVSQNENHSSNINSEEADEGHMFRIGRTVLPSLTSNAYHAPPLYMRGKIPLDARTVVTLPFEQPPNPRILKVGLIGAVNAGKSTLLNNILKNHVSAVSQKRNATTEVVKGVLSDEESGVQIIFYDAPGIVNTSKDSGDADRMREAWRTFAEVDLVLYVMDSVKRPSAKDLEVLRWIAPLESVAVDLIRHSKQSKKMEVLSDPLKRQMLTEEAVSGLQKELDQLQQALVSLRQQQAERVNNDETANIGGINGNSFDEEAASLTNENLKSVAENSTRNSKSTTLESFDLSTSTVLYNNPDSLLPRRLSDLELQERLLQGRSLADLTIGEKSALEAEKRKFRFAEKRLRDEAKKAQNRKEWLQSASLVNEDKDSRPIIERQEFHDALTNEGRWRDEKKQRPHLLRLPYHKDYNIEKHLTAAAQVAEWNKNAILSQALEDNDFNDVHQNNNNTKTTTTLNASDQDFEKADAADAVAQFMKDSGLAKELSETSVNSNDNNSREISKLEKRALEHKQRIDLIKQFHKPDTLLSDKVVNSLFKFLEESQPDIVKNVLNSSVSKDDAQTQLEKLNEMKKMFGQDAVVQAKPVVMVLTKGDLLEAKTDADLRKDMVRQHARIRRFFLVSSRDRNLSVTPLINYLRSKAQPGDWLYAPDVQTDLSKVKQLKLAIRTQLMRNLNDELPYNIVQQTVAWARRKDNVLVIEHELLVKNVIQAKIVCGKKCSALHAMREKVIHNLQKAWKEEKIMLYLHVKVDPDAVKTRTQSITLDDE